MTVAPRKRDRRRVVLAVAYTAALWAVCSIPGHSLPFSALLSWDKVWHLLGFAALFVFWRRAGYATATVAAGAFVYGVAIEVWQHVAPIGRFFDPLDVLASATGILAAAIVLAVASRVSTRGDLPRQPAG
jgi:hypothetical protein